MVLELSQEINKLQMVDWIFHWGSTPKIWKVASTSFWTNDSLWVVYVNLYPSVSRARHHQIFHMIKTLIASTLDFACSCSHIWNRDQYWHTIFHTFHSLLQQPRLALENYLSSMLSLNRFHLSMLKSKQTHYFIKLWSFSRLILQQLES